jgi:hypothetical protein
LTSVLSSGFQFGFPLHFRVDRANHIIMQKVSI